MLFRIGRVPGLLHG
uniref:Uncharacterized protein n=1 Tax=Arundo donax TaxID=35708 RepID=A0A0A8ZEJ3_ARUDO